MSCILIYFCVAQQDAERAKFVVEKAEQEKQASVIRAQAEAHAARLLSDAMSVAGTGVLELRRIEAAREIAQTLSGSKNITFLPAGQQTLFNLGSLAA